MIDDSDIVTVCLYSVDTLQETRNGGHYISTSTGPIYVKIYTPVAKVVNFRCVNFYVNRTGRS